MQLDIVSRTESIFSGEVDEVTVPAYNGPMGILPGHTPLLAVLVPGKVRYTEPGGRQTTVDTERGIVTVDDDTVLVVIESLRGEVTDPTEL